MAVDGWRQLGLDDIECRQVQDTAYLDGVLLEDTIDWYAQHTNGDVWYMGEISKNYDEDGFLEDLSRTPQIQQLLGRLQRSIDGETLLRARRWGNIANGALLAATGPIALVVSVFGRRWRW